MGINRKPNRICKNKYFISIPKKRFTVHIRKMNYALDIMSV